MDWCCLGFLRDSLSQNAQNSTGEAVSWLWNLVVGRILNLILLVSREEELRREMRDLIDKRTDILVEISNGELDNMGPTQQAKTWLEEVDKIEARAADFRVSFQQRGPSSEGSSLRFFDRLGCEAVECLKEVKRLKTQRSNLPPLIPAPPPAVLEQLDASIMMVGEEGTMSRIRRLVMEDEEAGITGIYGMGGIGKTTLLKAINDELLDRGPGRFDLVIWVTVSKQLDVLKVQDDIAKRLGTTLEKEENREERAVKLNGALSKRKFLLLLDDLWEKLDLRDVGILSSSFRKGSKLVFTTRSQEVCDDMDAKEKVKVPLLDPESSWELFRQKLGRREDQWDPSVRSLAEAVCQKCGGLPITLITVGRAMAGATTPGEWEEALMGLRGVPAELRGMKDEVLIRLKFSLDKLTGKLRECLLYCALFPEDHSIEIQRLIEYWVGEGLLEGEYSPDSIDRARNRGRSAITSLKAACLLEDGDTEGKRVKLHDTVREMALWITSGKCDGENGNVFLVNSGERLTRVPTPERWTEATRISLRDNEISVLPEKPQCHHLHTLLLYENRPLKEIPVGFFQFMPRLGVLDLQYTGISHLPPGIGSLVELRYLDLSWTDYLESLPVELGRLTKLRQLRLEWTLRLKRIPREAISSLTGLQSLNMYESGYEWRGGWEEGDHEGRQLCLKDLDGMGQLTGLHLSIINGMTQEGMQALQKNSGRLCALIRSVELKEVGSKFFDLSTCLEIMKGLTQLKIVDCPHLEELILNTNQLSHCPQLEKLELRGLPLARISWTDGNVSERGPSTAAIFKYLVYLNISHCGALEDITWIRDLPSIESVSLSRCSKIVNQLSHCPQLKYLRLSRLSLARISWTDGIVSERGPSTAAIFKNLVRLWISDCDALEDVTWIRDLACMEIFWLSECPKIEELVVVEEVMMGQNVADFENDSFFPKLKEIVLINLPNLRSICRHPLLFPSLEYVCVSGCPELKKLPFGLPSAKNIRDIKGEQEWWDALEWDHEDVRSKFTPYFDLNYE